MQDSKSGFSATSAGNTAPATANPRAHLDSQRGLTLIELLVVIAVVTAVAALSIASVAGALDRSRQRATMADMRSITKAIESYAVDHNDPPDDIVPFLEVIESLTPYYSSSLPSTDHWGYTYRYERDDRGNYTLQSVGKDGIEGADITQDTQHDFNRDIVVNNGIFVSAPL